MFNPAKLSYKINKSVCLSVRILGRWCAGILFIIFPVFLEPAFAGYADSINLYVLRPVVEIKSVTDPHDITKLDRFCGYFTKCFRKDLKEKSATMCKTIFTFIDYDNEPEAREHAERNRSEKKFALAAMYFRGEIEREPNGYVLNVSLKEHDNTIVSEEIARIQYSEVDDFAKAQEIAGIMAKDFLTKMCKKNCDPHIVQVFYNTKTPYYRNLEKAMDLLFFHYDRSADDADKIDQKIVKLKEDLVSPPDELILSYYVLQGFFWKNLRSNKRKARENFIIAQKAYCTQKITILDVNLLKTNCGNFTDFEEYINDQIQKCN